MFTASLSNTLLLSQVILGATLTALGAAAASPILVTLFGAMNTIIAGLVAYLKSRGQPMRARMYSEDLDRLVDEIENSGTMWLGIAANVHGYDAIDVDDKVTVRGEVARLTRLWEAAVRKNLSNDPDMYSAGQAPDGGEGGLRSRAANPPIPAPAAAPPAPPPPAVAPPAATSADKSAAVPLPASAPLVKDDDPDAAPALTTPVKPPAKKPTLDADAGKPAETAPAAPAAPAAPPKIEESKPVDASKPAEAAKPTEEIKPAEAAKPAEIPKPAETPKPVEAPKPAEAQIPVETLRPDESLDPDASPASAPLEKVSSRGHKHGAEAEGSSGAGPSGSGSVQGQRANESLKRQPSGAPPGSSGGPKE